MPKAKRFKRKRNSGIHNAFIDGKRILIRPGDHITCEPKELGSQISRYEQIPFKKGQDFSPLRIVIAKNEDSIRVKSWLLNPDFKAGVGQFQHTPADRTGLIQILDEKENEDFNGDGQAIGEMSSCKIRLKSALQSWQIQVDQDALGIKKLNEPEGIFLETIAIAQARYNVLLAEIKEIKLRILVAEDTKSTETDNRSERLKFAGIGKKRNHKYYEFDGRKIAYKRNKPFFKDTGESLSDYIILVKKHKQDEATKAQSKKSKATKSHRLQTEGNEASPA